MFVKYRFKLLLIVSIMTGAFTFIRTTILPSPVAAASCTTTSKGYTALTDLINNRTYTDASGTIYKGGLYGNGSNIRSDAWETKGLEAAGRIFPRDASGNRDDTNGYIVLASIGMSNATEEWNGGSNPENSTNFIAQANAFANKSSKVVVVDAAAADQTADVIDDYSVSYWQTTVPSRVASYTCGSSACDLDQVQAVWVKEAISIPTTTDTIQVLKGYYQNIARHIKTRFPNAQIAYFSSRIYAGYAAITLNPEPYAYESGFAVQQLISDQINYLNNINFDPALGTVTAPWIAWGPYLWSDGTSGRNDGLVWECQDLENGNKNNDGTHPSRDLTSPPEGYGQKKVASMLLNFFSTEPTARSWFLNNPNNYPSLSTPWNQTSWDGGPGQLLWSDTTKYTASLSIDTSPSGSLTLHRPTNWFNTSWKYRKRIVFDNTSQAEDLANFPVLVKLTSANFDFTKAQSAGEDIRFTDSDGTTSLSYEIESYDSSGQTASIWVKVPQIDASSRSDKIYIYYGNSAAADGQAATSVWGSSVKGRWHLKETTLTDGAAISDSTSNTENLQVVSGATAASGQIDGAITLSGSSQYLVQSPRSSYASSNADSNQALFNNANSNYLAQGIQVSAAISVGNIRLWLRKQGSGTPTTTHLAVRIETDTSGKPSGTAVTNGTSKCVAVPTSTSYAFVSFKFATAPALSASTQYHLVVKPYTESTCATEQAAADGSNFISWGYDNSSSTYSSGDRAAANSTPTWTTQTGSDHVFEIYNNVLDTTGSVTFGAWVKRANTTSSRYAVISKGTLGAGNTALSYGQLLETNDKFVGKASGDGTIPGSVAQANSANSDTNWHLVITRYTAVGNGTSLVDIFVDGSTTSSVAVSTAATPLFDSKFPLALGATFNDSGTAQMLWNGTVDEAFVISDALTSSWIAATYKSENNTFNTYDTEEQQIANSGSLASTVFDTGQATNFASLTYTVSTPANTTATVKIRTADNRYMNGSPAFSTCSGISSGASIANDSCVTNGHRFMQYQLSLSNTDSVSTPTFSDISISFSDASPPKNFELLWPDDLSYTNSDRPDFRWRWAQDVGGSGLSSYGFTVDNGGSGDFTVTGIPPSQTTNFDTNTYLTHYDLTSDGNPANDEIAFHTKPSADWADDTNGGRLKEGRRIWKALAIDAMGNQRQQSRTLFVDRTAPGVSVYQINNQVIHRTVDAYVASDNTPTIFGRITDPLVGDKDENKIASGPSKIEIKIEKQSKLGNYQKVISTTITPNTSYWKSTGGVIYDNSQNMSDKIANFSYTPDKNFSAGTYRLSFIGEDNVGNRAGSEPIVIKIISMGGARPQPAVEKTLGVDNQTSVAPLETFQPKVDSKAIKPNIIERLVRFIGKFLTKLFVASP